MSVMLLLHRSSTEILSCRVHWRFPVQIKSVPSSAVSCMVEYDVVVFDTSQLDVFHNTRFRSIGRHAYHVEVKTKRYSRIVLGSTSGNISTEKREESPPHAFKYQQ